METTSFSNPTRIVLISSSRGYDQNNLISYESRRLLHSCLSTHSIAFVRPLDSSNTKPLTNNWRMCLNINLWFSVGSQRGLVRTWKSVFLAGYGEGVASSTRSNTSTNVFFATLHPDNNLCELPRLVYHLAYDIVFSYFCHLPTYFSSAPRWRGKS